MYWYAYEPNFGDELSPAIVEKLSGRKVKFADRWKRVDLVGLGSVLHHIHDPDYSGYVWGTGLIAARDHVNAQKAKVCALRGTLTSACYRKTPPALGDPGLLAHLLVEPGRKKWKLGVAPHYIDQDHPAPAKFAAQSDDIKLIDVRSGLRKVLEEIAACERIVASAMHALIAADALGIPNRWIRLSDDLHGGGFKFRDYYSVFGIDNPQPMPFAADDTLDAVLQRLGDSHHCEGIDRIKQQLIETFPFRK